MIALAADLLSRYFSDRFSKINELAAYQELEKERAAVEAEFFDSLSAEQKEAFAKYKMSAISQHSLEMNYSFMVGLDALKDLKSILEDESKYELLLRQFVVGDEV